MKTAKIYTLLGTVFTVSGSSSATLTNFDFISDIARAGIVGSTYGSNSAGGVDTVRSSEQSILDTSYNNSNGQVLSQNFDLIDYNGGTATFGSDGVNDVSVIITTSGLGSRPAENTNQNLYDNRSSFWDDGVAGNSNLGSTLSTVSLSKLTVNPVAPFTDVPILTQTIEIRFLSQISAKVASLEDFTVFGSNSLGADENAWENTTFQVLDKNYNPFSSLETSRTQVYRDGRTSQGFTSPGIFYANGDTLDNVGVITGEGKTDTIEQNPVFGVDNFSVNGKDWNDAAFENSQIGGVRITHTVVDTRGTSDGKFNHTITLLTGGVSEIEVFQIPEPTSGMLALFGSLGLLFHRRRES